MIGRPPSTTRTETHFPYAPLFRCRRAGIKDGDISLVADSSIGMQEVPDDLRNAENDFMPAAVRGAMAGGSAGLIGGTTTPISLTIAGVDRKSTRLNSSH